MGWGTLEAVVDEIEDDEVAATAYLDALSIRKSAAEELRPLIVWAVTHIRRETVRRAESAAFGRRSERKPIGEIINSVDERKRLLDAKFALGDGRFVSWGDATQDDHEARIVLLRRMVSGLSDAIERHEQAIEAIAAAGVTCLRDLDVCEVAA